MEEPVHIADKKVLILGYHPSLGGGVVNVINILLKHLSYVHLLPIVSGYDSLLKQGKDYALALVQLIRKLPSLSHIHVIIGSKGDVLRGVLPIFLARLYKVKVIAHFHTGYGVLIAPGSRKGITLYNKCLNYISSYGQQVFLSDALQQEFLNRNKAAKKSTTHVIPNALDDLWFSQLPSSDRSIDVLFVGRWCAEKGIEDLVAICKRMPSVSFQAISNGPKQVAGVENLTMHNWGDMALVKRLMLESRVIILPSYAEAYPTVLIEGLACGTPFVASSLIGIQGIASNCKAGQVVPVGDIDAFIQHINAYLRNDDSWKSASESGHAWVKAEHTVENVLCKWQALYCK